MGGQSEKNETKHPFFTVLCSPFFRGVQNHPHSPLYKNQLTALTDGKRAKSSTLQHSLLQPLVRMLVRMLGHSAATSDLIPAIIIMDQPVRRGRGKASALNAGANNQVSGHGGDDGMV